MLRDLMDVCIDACSLIEEFLLVRRMPSGQRKLCDRVLSLCSCSWHHFAHLGPPFYTLVSTSTRQKYIAHILFCPQSSLRILRLLYAVGAS